MSILHYHYTIGGPSIPTPPAPVRLRVLDKTDTSALTVDLSIAKGLPHQDEPDIPWSYAIDGVDYPGGLANYDFMHPNELALVSDLYVGTAKQVTLKLGNLTAWGGPYNFNVDLYFGNNTKFAHIKDGTNYINAVPYVNVGGVWTQSEPWVMNSGEWSPAG